MARKQKANGGTDTTSVQRKRRSTQTNPFDGETQYPTRQPSIQRTAHISAIDLLAKTEPQRQMIEAYRSGLNVFATGSAGTGKTYVSLALGLQDLISGSIKKIVIVRSAVQVRDQGFLPGTEAEKMAVYSLPYKCMVNEITKNDAMWEILTKRGLIDFISTSFIRGITLDECLVIIDESQNLDYDEGSSVCTRLGVGSRLIVCGDTKQSDLQRHRETSGLGKLVAVATKIPKYFDIVHFTPYDIVRSPLVKAWIMADEEMD